MLAYTCNNKNYDMLIFCKQYIMRQLPDAASKKHSYIFSVIILDFFNFHRRLQWIADLKSTTMKKNFVLKHVKDNLTIWIITLSVLGIQNILKHYAIRHNHFSSPYVTRYHKNALIDSPIIYLNHIQTHFNGRKVLLFTTWQRDNVFGHWWKIKRENY